MLLKEDGIRLHHMLDAAREALDFAQGRRREDLEVDRQLVLSLVRSLEVIGEAASKVSAEFKAARPDIPWLDITGMRNRLIHAYFDVNLNVVWKTVTQEMPALAEQLEEILSS